MTDRKIAEAFPPGDFLKEELEARNWSQVELAEIIGRQPYVVNELIMGKRPITPEIAKALGEAFNTSAQYWMNLESIYQLWRKFKGKKYVENKITRRVAKRITTRNYGNRPRRIHKCTTRGGNGEKC